MNVQGKQRTQDPIHVFCAPSPLWFQFSCLLDVPLSLASVIVWCPRCPLLFIAASIYSAPTVCQAVLSTFYAF